MSTSKSDKKGNLIKTCKTLMHLQNKEEERCAPKMNHSWVVV